MCVSESSNSSASIQKLIDSGLRATYARRLLFSPPAGMIVMFMCGTDLLISDQCKLCAQLICLSFQESSSESLYAVTRIIIVILKTLTYSFETVLEL